MRKSLIGICVSIPLALVAVACGDDDDSDSGNMTGGRAGDGGKPAAGAAGMTGGVAGSGGNSARGGMAGSSAAGNGGSSDTGSGGSSDAGSANGGTSSGGAEQGGDEGLGGVGAVGQGGAAQGGSAEGDAGGAGEGGVGGSGPEAIGANVVYTMSNAATGNEVLGFLRAENGSLTPMTAPFATGGNGTGSGLGEQGAVAYDVENQRVYVVNAGDHSFTVFRVEADGSLSNPKKVTPAGFGEDAASLLGPKSVTFRDDVVYVLFQGAATVASKVAGWKVKDSAAGFVAEAIAGSALALSNETQSVDPAQISFSPDGKWLIVTEKQSGANGTVAGNGSIDTFAVNEMGVATKKGFYATGAAPAGGFQKVPYGFGFVGNFLVISEAGSTGTGSYSYENGVVLPVTTAQFLSTAPAPCWVATSGPYAYVANAQGPNLSGFKIGTNGGLSGISPIDNALVASTGRVLAGESGPTIQGPTDEAVSQDGKHLYVLNARVPSIGIFEIAANGTLTRVGVSDFAPATLAQLPVGSVGLAAR